MKLVLYLVLFWLTVGALFVLVFWELVHWIGGLCLRDLWDFEFCR